MTSDIICIGGGVMSCATAYYLLKNDPTLKITIIEKDTGYTHNSTVLSDGNTRLQFNIKENIQISQYTLTVLETFAKDMGVRGEQIHPAFRQEGNLFLTDHAGAAQAQAGQATQKALGCPVDWLTPEDVAQRYPLISPAPLAGGTFCALDGTMDPNAILLGYKNKIIDMGAQFIEAEVAAILKDEQSNQVTGVTLTNGDTLNAKIIVNGAGAWAGALAQTAGITLPIAPTMRQIFIIQADLRPPEFTYPLIIFPSGLYLVHEHGNKFMVSKSLASDPIGYDFTLRRDVFMDVLWEELVEYAPAFERLKLIGGWAGLYAVNTFDGNAILGECPELAGLMLINGFSGHGFQQCHAVGRYLAEKILGLEHALDLSIFDPRRILENTPVFEGAGKLV